MEGTRDAPSHRVKYRSVGRGAETTSAEGWLQQTGTPGWDSPAVKYAGPAASRAKYYEIQKVATLSIGTHRSLHEGPTFLGLF